LLIAQSGALQRRLWQVGPGKSAQRQIEVLGVARYAKTRNGGF
jgi:hypothetical protein